MFFTFRNIPLVMFSKEKPEQTHQKLASFNAENSAFLSLSREKAEDAGLKIKLQNQVLIFLHCTFFILNSLVVWNVFNIRVFPFPFFYL